MKASATSAVMTLGNRLTKKYGRSEAFRRAWETLRRGSLDLHVAGVSFGRRQEALRRLATYAPESVRLFIAPDTTNEKDQNALLVLAAVQGGRGLFPIGYLPARAAWALSVLPQHGKALQAAFRGVVGHTHAGARIAVKIA